MKQLLFLVWLVMFAGLANARMCTEIEADALRLACFDRILNCVAVDSDSERLSCYDQVFYKPPARDGVSPAKNDSDARAPASDQRTVGSSERISVEEKVEHAVEQDRARSGTDEPIRDSSATADFGKAADATAPVKYIEGTIVDVMQNAQRIDYLRLDNGHIWREIEDSRVRFKIGQSVRIEEGVFNSFNLRVDGVKKLIKARRVD